MTSTTRKSDFRFKHTVLGMGLALLLLGGCNKKMQKAAVLSKDYVAAASKDQPLTDERQLDHERWLIYVEMDNRRRAQVDVTPDQWRDLKVGDRVRVNYDEGKYTGTIWGSRLEKIP